jgi:hypothetical protein
MPHPLSGQSVEEATAVEGMASRRTVRVVEIAELLGVTQARAHQIAPFKAGATSGPRAAGPSASVRRAASSTTPERERISGWSPGELPTRSLDRLEVESKVWLNTL